MNRHVGPDHDHLRGGILGFGVAYFNTFLGACYLKGTVMKNKSILFSPWLFQSPGLQQELKSAHGDRSLMIQDLVAETVVNLFTVGG